MRFAPAEGPLGVTHQALAGELGTAREVVSRQLEEFERRGWVNLGRGQIEIVNLAALCDLVTNAGPSGPAS